MSFDSTLECSLGGDVEGGTCDPITWDNVVALQANLEDVAELAQTMILDYVNNGLNPKAFGGCTPRYTLARSYLAAHMGELSRRNGGGQVSSESISANSIAISYAQAQSSDQALMQTPGGQSYLALVRVSPLRIGGGRRR